MEKHFENCKELGEQSPKTAMCSCGYSNEDFPLHIVDDTTAHIYVGSDWQGFQWHTITMSDLVCYIRHETSSMSGCRSLGKISGDWRPMDELAHAVERKFIEYMGNYAYQRNMKSRKVQEAVQA